MKVGDFGLVFILLFFLSCPLPLNRPGDQPDNQTDGQTDDQGNPINIGNLPRTYNESIQKVEFTGNTATINLKSLKNNDIYLVKVNTSDLIVNAANTGNALVPYTDTENTSRSSIPNKTFLHEDQLPPIGHPAALEFNANPPPIANEIQPRLQSILLSPAVNDTRKFWVETYYNSGAWREGQAKLRATGTYGNIWVMDENYSSTAAGKPDNKITSEQAEALAGKFDLIYPAVTNILGYEYGGGPGGNGGRDSDPKVQILVYDIVDEEGDVAAAGYFWSKDYYQQSQLGSSLKTNLAEIFYIDTSQVSTVPEYIYSALIHEFQHMINFNVKYVVQRKNSATWYNEMLSMMTEDIVAPLIGVTPANRYHEIRTRMPTFLGNYDKAGFTEWNTSENIADSYAKGFAFGAYLLRNFGGADLLKTILANDTTNIDSITSALNEFSEGLDFYQALNRFGEAMVFSGTQIPEGVLTFQKTVTKTINDFTYTASGFDVWKDFTQKGPVIFNMTQKQMRPHSITIHSANGWKNKSGNISITLQQPGNPAIEFYLMVK